MPAARDGAMGAATAAAAGEPSHRQPVPAAGSLGMALGADAAAAMERLARSFDLAQSLGRLGCFEIDMTRGVAFGTPHFFEQYGWRPDKSIMTRPEWMQRVHAEDRPLVKAFLAGLSTSTSAECADIEYRIVRFDREVRWVASRFRLEHDARGGLVRCTGIQQDITERRQAEERVRWLARHDQLTALANRTSFHEQLTEAMTREMPPEGRQAVLLIKLDGYGAISDAHGHHVGDGLLSLVAERLKRCTAPGEILARIGTDEFGIITGPERDPVDLANRIIDLLQRPFLVEAVPALIGAFVGIARLKHCGQDAEDPTHAAKLALDEASKSGRERWACFEPGMGAQAREQRALVEDLRRAAALGQLELHYQPLVGASLGDIVGFEALLRWNRAGHGLVSPAQFIPVAEQHGLMSEIGDWVLETACREALRWPEHLRVAVNVSPDQFSAGDHLMASVRHALKSSGLAANRLELEVTESTLMAHEQQALEQLHRIRALGVKIWIDDFGTGYSSLSRLLSFPFDGIKIDRSFIGALGRDDKAALLVRSIVALGSSLTISTVAEGVETEAQAIMVRANGFTDMQGFLIGKPMPSSMVISFIAHGSAVGAQGEDDATTHRS